MNDEEFGSLKSLKLKYRRGDEIIQLFSRIGFPQEIRSPLFNLKKFQKAKKRPFCRVGFPRENRQPLFNLKKFQNAEKSIAESWRID